LVVVYVLNFKSQNLEQKRKLFSKEEKALKIAVCVKQTFDTEAKIVLKDGKVSDDGVNLIINPYDET
jgi:hypothetical protein